MQQIGDDDRFPSARLTLRLVRPEDCNERYLGWLTDTDVNQYLETRWAEQTIDSISRFVERLRAADDSYLFAIVHNGSDTHIGNIKVGPLVRHHGYADVSYFIGERRLWGRGYATEAIRSATCIGFRTLGLHRLQAGVYEANIGSARALEKVGYVLEGRLRSQLSVNGSRQDHLLYALLRDDFQPPSGVLRPTRFG